MTRKIDKAMIQTATLMLLQALGEDPNREGLRDTPRRVADAWEEFLLYQPGKMTTFESLTTDQMVIVRNVETWSFCEHHLLPFRCIVSMGYITTGSKVLGLSKLARIAEQNSRALQMQERITQQIADDLVRLTASPDVAVYVVGTHDCMTTRGARAHGSETVTSAMLGVFRHEPETRAEFFAGLKGGR